LCPGPMQVRPEESSNARIIDGRKIANEIELELREQVEQLKQKGVAPTLGVVLVGARKDSETYVRMKKRAAEAAGIGFILKQFPENIEQKELIVNIRALNEDPTVHGIIVQLPLPAHIDEKTALSEVSLEKDADGFHPLNIGSLALKGHDPLFLPGTPKGIMLLLERSGIIVAGKRAVVLGRSNIVGIPIALLLMHADATITMCHSKTPQEDMIEICKSADILVCAVGKPEMVKGSWIKSGAVVIDVGTNSVTDPTKKTGYRLVGDVAFEEARQKAGAITPVPGGVGPMTVCMLLMSTIQSAQRFQEKAQGKKC